MCLAARELQVAHDRVLVVSGRAFDDVGRRRRVVVGAIPMVGARRPPAQWSVMVPGVGAMRIKVDCRLRTGAAFGVACRDVARQ